MRKRYRLPYWKEEHKLLGDVCWVPVSGASHTGYCYEAGHKFADVFRVVGGIKHLDNDKYGSLLYCFKGNK